MLLLAFAPQVLEVPADDAVVIDNADGTEELWRIELDVDGDRIPLDQLADAVLDEGGPDLWSTTFEVSRDAATGLPTGKRQHKPITAVRATCVTVWGVTVCA